MVAKNGTGSGAPAKAPEPARGESAGAGEKEKEMIEKFIDFFSGYPEYYLLHASIEIPPGSPRDLVWFKVTWDDANYFEDFMNWLLMLISSYSAYRALRVEIGNAKGPYVVHIGVPRRELI
jgi:hypothetical protein